MDVYFPSKLISIFCLTFFATSFAKNESITSCGLKCFVQKFPFVSIIHFFFDSETNSCHPLRCLSFVENNLKDSLTPLQTICQSPSCSLKYRPPPIICRLFVSLQCGLTTAFGPHVKPATMINSICIVLSLLRPQQGR